MKLLILQFETQEEGKEKVQFIKVHDKGKATPLNKDLWDIHQFIPSIWLILSLIPNPNHECDSVRIILPPAEDLLLFLVVVVVELLLPED
jgi:hypothetical protein